MKSTRLFTLGTAVALGVASSAFAGGNFSFTAPGGLINDNDITIFPLSVSGDMGMQQILSLDVTISGLNHSHPDDLGFYLAAPNLSTIKLLQNQGDGFDLSNATITFSDGGASPAPDEAQIVSGATYLPRGLSEGTDQGFASFIGKSGTGQWLLLAVDDSAGDTGSFGELKLQGTFVPEPATISLLVLGAAAALRRRRAVA